MKSNRETFSCRFMDPGDIRAVERLMGQCFARSWSGDAIRSMFETGGYINMVMETGKPSGGPAGKSPKGTDCDPEIVAYAGCKVVLDEADIVNVCVRPDMRKQGLATVILSELLEQALKEGIRRIFLEVRKSNEAAVRLYRGAGFKEAGLRKDYYSKPKEDALLMVRE